MTASAANEVQCEICPKQCIIAEGQSGDCRIRVNRRGVLTATTYGRPCAVHVDPVEKKPLFHYLPGTGIFSIATAGCNLHCRNCQNWQISQAGPLDIDSRPMSPDEVVRLARKTDCLSIAYTYSDPVVYYEYALDTSEKAREAGLGNVLVTAAYINPEPLRRLARVTDAANVDLKFISDKLYDSNCDGSLRPVLDALVVLREEGVWIEVTNLVIPTMNDKPEDFRRLATWIVENLGADTPLHFSRFHPQYRLLNLPTTPAKTLDRAREVALECGIHHCYIGNVWGSEGEFTFCPHDGATLIKRVGYTITENNLGPGGTCPECGRAIAGIWQRSNSTPTP